MNKTVQKLSARLGRLLPSRQGVQGFQMPLPRGRPCWRYQTQESRAFHLAAAEAKRERRRARNLALAATPASGLKMVGTSCP